ncbi:alkyl hydroperoxide reductase [Candidatus Kaiserbacteria bacterium RIFCSPHIGHO2_02_FULL_49_16]|uniref:Alkyl hydroperoxide reductase n=1 Tax=Candidatus Kaiserbacteria bacterium RIFCSPHIGHO2_02_FULL_49_16 TaxID=1798490 RepID=A0A1F6DBI6_9BACT|nr:MAG: alkyl hydroperoxide reductase [Candidatus Kaiserbacteria bacterium RIFCSPHIGHO2_02_FULL_49_16]
MVKTESFMRLQKGDSAPNFTLPGIDGRAVSLSLGTDGVFILFMCNHCPYVKVRMGEVVALHREFGNKIAFVGINSSDPDYPGEGVENMKAFAKERGILFPYLMDEDGIVARAYGASCTPDPFLFDKDAKLVFHGRITDALEPQEEVKERTMRENMRKLLAGQPIEPWFNPSLGCSIKFKA